MRTKLTYNQLRQLIKEEINRVNNKLLLETGEPDQDYDKEFFDKLCQSIEEQTGIIGVSHREFDKYQGVYLHVPGIDTFWIKEAYYTGERTDDISQYKYRSVVINNGNGNQYSPANIWGDYWELPEDYIFKGGTLTITHMNGKKTVIYEPAKYQVPKPNEVMPSTFSYKENTETEHYVFYPESNPEILIEISYEKRNGNIENIYDGDIIEYIYSITNDKNNITNESYNRIKKNNQLKQIIKEEVNNYGNEDFEDEYEMTEEQFEDYFTEDYPNYEVLGITKYEDDFLLLARHKKTHKAMFYYTRGREMTMAFDLLSDVANVLTKEYKKLLKNYKIKSVETDNDYYNIIDDKIA